MDTGRDLACPALWQESLERSLARRGRPTRSSLELFQLRGERDLSHPDVLRESLRYSHLRRSAATRRPSIAVPGAGGISALALLAAATLPGLVGGRGGRTSPPERAASRNAQPDPVPLAGLAIDPTLAARATAALPAPPAPPARVPTRRAAVIASVHRSAPRTITLHPAHVSRTITSQPAHLSRTTSHPAHLSRTTSHPAHLSRTTSHPARLSSASSSSAHSPRPSHPAAAPRHIALARDAAARHARGGAAHAVSGGAAPSARNPSIAASRVPAKPQPPGHPSTGGGAVEAATRSTTPPQPVNTAHPRPVATTHPRPVATAHPRPVATAHPRPVVATHPAPTAPAPAPPPPAAGGYVNPLAGASVTPERIDQGVDYAGSGTLGALGNGKMTYVGTTGTGWPGAFVEYRLSDGAYAGRYVFYAESISPAAGLHVGQAVRAGQPIASIHGGIEIGWGSGVGTQPLAQALGQWHGGDDANNVASPAGKSFSALVAQLGGPPGKVEG